MVTLLVWDQASRFESDVFYQVDIALKRVMFWFPHKLKTLAANLLMKNYRFESCGSRVAFWRNWFTHLTENQAFIRRLDKKTFFDFY